MRGSAGVPIKSFFEKGRESTGEVSAEGGTGKEMEEEKNRKTENRTENSSESRMAGGTEKEPRKSGSRIFLRMVSVFMAAFAVISAGTWKKNGWCMGDEILETLGLKAWSDGDRGTHYTFFYGMALLILAALLYSRTAENRQKAFRQILILAAALAVLAGMLAGFLP